MASRALDSLGSPRQERRGNLLHNRPIKLTSLPLMHSPQSVHMLYLTMCVFVKYGNALANEMNRTKISLLAASTSVPLA